MIEQLLKQIADQIAPCSFVAGIVLGGSRATGMATENSDIDIGIYYERERMDFDRLNGIAAGLDDLHRENLVCREGEWGNWVNCGGWLTVKGYHVDLILRDIARVQDILDQTERGETAAHYQTGHPHGYIDAMYRGELAAGKILYARDQSFTEMKERAEVYPEALRRALISFFMFEAKFSCMLAEGYGRGEDLYYVAGHLFRSVSALNQVLFALNQTYCLNEKKAVRRIREFPVTLPDYQRRVNEIFGLTAGTLALCIQALRELCGDAEALVDQEMCPAGDKIP
ncbi:nucleotidyltransferase domain-containing protein [Enterocloster lavalensis]|uniref:nucleotidyltransferase domain-containing protein n=1 Tax=Enterocloster lavalensis TaxID=460384 RepID=UPI00140A44F3|nr:nucleotidyltransferase domain-containing protein [Enterocloster lavalensis]